MAEASATRLEALRKTAAAFGFGYGLLVVFCYCFFDLKFYPSGLSTGDVLFFLFAAIGIGLMSLFCIALGATMFLPALFFDSCLPPAASSTTMSKLGDALWYASPAGIVLLAWAFASWESAWTPLKVVVMIAGAILLIFGFWATIRQGLKLARAQGSKRTWADALAEGFGYLVVAPIVCYVLIYLGKTGWYLLLAIGFAGIAGALGLSLLETRTQTASASIQDEREKRARRMMGVRVLFMIALLPAVVIPEVRTAVFVQLGVRTMNTAVSLDKTNLALLQSAADTAGFPLSVCRGEDGNGIVSPINVLWHATGARSLVQLTGGPGVDLELNSSGLKLLRGAIERCIQIKETLLFASDSAVLLGDAEKTRKALHDELIPQLRGIGEKWQIKSVTVIGHADPMPLSGQGNYALAMQRAEVVKAMLMQSPDLREVTEPKSRSEGSRYPVKQCDTKDPVAYQRACNEVNRRVEVRFRLEARQSKKGTATTGAS